MEQSIKPSEFLSDLHSHSIYEASAIQADFEKETGVKLGDPLRGFTMTKKMAKEIAATGGEVKPESIGKSMVGGYSFAQIVCNRLGVEYESSLGRGTQFWRCVDALRKAGQ